MCFLTTYADHLFGLGLGAVLGLELGLGFRVRVGKQVVRTCGQVTETPKISCHLTNFKIVGDDYG